jgi:hypothetical protein
MSSEKYVWNANDWSNIITISASALASVLLVVFKSRCIKIKLCYGLINCDRQLPEESSDEENNEKDKLNDKKDKNKKVKPTSSQAPPEPEPEPEIDSLV